jgi:hypothetical protein
MVAATAIAILATRSCVSTGVSYTGLAWTPRGRNPNAVSQGSEGGQAIGPSRPIHLLPKVLSKYSTDDIS